MSGEVLTDSVTLHCGDCLDDVLKTLPANSVDACVTDPPYHLTTGAGAVAVAWDTMPANRGKPQVTKKSIGFMGKAWDGGDIAFRPELWREVLRVLKPGGHLLSFGGTRTYHRMACAIEDAGFEIRDQIQWLYGSGFPKSMDISKQIDKRGGIEVGWFGPWLKQWRAERGIAQKDIAALFPSKTGGKTGCVANWELGFNLPTPEQFNLICATFGLPFASMEEAEREFLRKGTSGNTAIWQANGGMGNFDITAPATDAARQWSGFGTALKPACEPIVLARKPLSESTVAANVLKWGTGALNIDACRVESDGDHKRQFQPTNTGRSVYGEQVGFQPTNADGRWPANVIHDGSDEVVGAFPGEGFVGGTPRAIIKGDSGADAFGNRSAAYGAESRGAGEVVGVDRKDSGSAARFFYTSKADSDDRLGSKHPTVKPLDLMQYLVRLVTPPKGLELVCSSCNKTRNGETTLPENLPTLCDTVYDRAQDSSLLFNKVSVSESDDTARELQNLRETEQALSSDLLFDRVSGDRLTASSPASEAMQSLSEDIPTEMGQPTGMLQPPMCGEDHRRTETEAESKDGARLLRRMASRPSNGDEARICHGASANNSEKLGQNAQVERGRTPYQRQESGQPSTESRSNEKDGARPAIEAEKVDADKLSALRDKNKVSSESPSKRKACPHCHGPLTAIERRPVVLDCFAGTGTLGEACIREGMRAILIEREEEYQEDIRRRMKLAMSGPDERSREGIKAKMKDKPADHGPLFA